MIRAANHSSYPRAGENEYDRHLLDVLERHERGEATDAEVKAIEDEVAALVVAEQSRAFIDVVTDGQIRWDGLVSYPARHLAGVEVNGEAPHVVGPISRREGFLAREYRGAAEVGAKAVKMVLPGPVLFARSCDDRHYRDRGALARAVAAVWAEEVADLVAAGCTIIQLDEPDLAAHPEDIDLVAETAARVFAAAGPNATTILSMYGGDVSGLADKMAQLPGTHLGIDLTIDANWAVLAALPQEKGVHLGLFDSGINEVEDAADIAAKIEPHRDRLEGRDVMVGPQRGMGALGRDTAFEKLLHARYLAETLRKAKGMRR
jgi:5-methyltetrahydropteroyltriglutamate--homocysteine methyltransferase